MMDKPFDEQLAVAAAVWNNFKMIREDTERAERVAKKRNDEACAQEQDAFRRFLDLAEKATLEPVNPHA